MSLSPASVFGRGMFKSPDSPVNKIARRIRMDNFASPPSDAAIVHSLESRPTKRKTRKRERERGNESPNLRSAKRAGRREPMRIDWTKDVHGAGARHATVDGKATCHVDKKLQVDDLMRVRAMDVERLPAKEKKKIKLVEVHKMIDFWQAQMNLILKRSWDQKKQYWITQAHNLLWRTCRDQRHLELPGAEAYPPTLSMLDRTLTPEDNHWRRVLISSARVTKIVSPEFDDLIYAPEGTSDTAEFEFHILFEFGFDCTELSWTIHHALSNRTTEKAMRNINLCDMIAQYVGNTKFQSDVLVYFKKSAVPWWEQDGIAKMRTWNPDTKQYEDLIDFAPGEQTYYVQRWTEASVLVSDYPDHLEEYFPVDEGSDTKLWRRVMQKKFIASICCQIVHTTVMMTTRPRSVGARNIMKQLSVVLKGWFIGILLGEAFSPATLKFEYDTRGPSLTPLAVATMTLNPAGQN